MRFPSCGWTVAIYPANSAQDKTTTVGLRAFTAESLLSKLMFMVWVSYKEKIKQLSDRIVEAQRPIRILDAIKWNPKIEADFFNSKAKELPKVDTDYYAKQTLDFDLKKKDEELAEIVTDIRTQIGDADDMGRLLVSMAEEYREVVRMLSSRGSKAFYESSRNLYGSTNDKFFDGSVSIMDQGRHLYDILTSLEGKFLGEEYPKEYDSEAVRKELQRRFENSFLKDRIEVRVDDGIVADAAAGSDVIKIKEGSKFSRKDIDIFEVHEGWVHVATSLNGKAQKVSSFLAKGPPRVAATQEGLAILMEILTFSTYPLRARAINDRILGVNKAEEGADFLEVYNFYLTERYGECEAYRNAMRVFRGGDVKGGVPFTKDISYCLGFIENYNFIRMAIRSGHPEIIPYLFAGKMHVNDIPLLYSRAQDGVVDAPLLLPPQFSDLNGLAVWMSFSNFLNGIDMTVVSQYYEGLFRHHL